MNNPYYILNVGQNATKQEIMKAQMKAMSEKNHSLQEIHIAVRQLLDPAKRLAADFLFCPSKIKAKRPQKIIIGVKIENVDVTEIDENAFDSLE